MVCYRCFDLFGKNNTNYFFMHHLSESVPESFHAGYDYVCNLPVTVCSCSIAVHQNTLLHTWPQRRKFVLTHWGRVTHIYVSKQTIIGSDNGLSPGQRQAIIWTNVGILLIGPLGTNFSDILMEMYSFSFKNCFFPNVVCEMASILSQL